MAVRDRNELARLLAAKLQTGYGAEVGVQAGWYSRELKKHWGGFLVLVDSWRHWPGAYDRDDANAAHDQHIANMAAVAKHFIDRPDVVLVRASSVVAAGLFPDAHFDWVYIDANHSLEAVRRDIAAWLPKVRAGGIIAGHDYGAPENRGFGVKQAVDEQFERSVQITNEDYGSWFVEKK